MRKAWLLLWCSALVAGDTGQLHLLMGDNRLFDLRRALEQPGWNTDETLLYRAVTECRFGHEAAGIRLLEGFLRTNPSVEMARKAHEEAAAALQRMGRYKEAAQELTEALIPTPQDDRERGGNENTRALMASLSEVAPQTVEFGADVPVQATRNRVGSWNVPVRLNGVDGRWIFDTGADFSTLTESEAKRMGLTAVEAPGYVFGSTGKKNSLRLAVAKDLQFGAAHVHNVVFLVLADAALHIVPVHYQIDGILGLPVLRAVGRVEVSGQGIVRLGPRAAVAEGTPNLFFDDGSVVAEISYNRHPLQMHLDTGANDTSLYPSFRKALTSEGSLRLRTKTEKTAGAGGIARQKAELVPRLGIEISETPVNLRKVSLLPEMPAGSARYRDGVIGMDALWGGFVLDFDAMRLAVRERLPRMPPRPLQ